VILLVKDEIGDDQHDNWHTHDPVQKILSHDRMLLQVDVTIRFRRQRKRKRVSVCEANADRSPRRKDTHQAGRDPFGGLHSRPRRGVRIRLAELNFSRSCGDSPGVTRRLLMRGWPPRSPRAAARTRSPLRPPLGGIEPAVGCARAQLLEQRNVFISLPQAAVR